MNFINRLKFYFSKPYNVILWGLAVLLSYLTIVSLGSIILDTFTVHSSEVMRISGTNNGDFTLYHWIKVLLDSSTSLRTFYVPFANTMFTSLGTCFVAMLLGGSVAWLVVHTNIKYKGFISKAFVLPYIMPSWTLAMLWLNLFKNSRIGGASGLVTVLTGIQTPDWLAYGAFPIIIVQGLHYAPFAYILIGDILRNMDGSLDDAAKLLKVGRFRVFIKITLPVIMSALISTFLLVFSGAMSEFAVPYFLGSPVRFQVLATQLYRTLTGTNPGYGYLIAFIMIAVGVLLLGIHQWSAGRRRSFTTTAGKIPNIAQVNLGAARGLISLFVVVLLLAVCIAPLISFTVESFMMSPGNYSISNFTTMHWVGEGRVTIASGEPGILRNKYVYLGLWNSLKLSVVASVTAGTVGILASYAIIRRRGSLLSSIVNNLTFFPYLIPNMAFGAMYLSMISVKRSFVPARYGSFALLALVGFVKYLPFAVRSGSNAVKQISREIEEAATITGAGWGKRMTGIILPIQKSNFLPGYILPFISCMGELPLFILLVSPSTRILTTMLFQYNQKGWSQYANAICLIIVVIVAGVNLIMNKLTSMSIDKGISG